MGSVIKPHRDVSAPISVLRVACSGVLTINIEDNAVILNEYKYVLITQVDGKIRKHSRYY